MSCLDSLTMAAWVEGTLADAPRALALVHIATPRYLAPEQLAGARGDPRFRDDC